MQPLPNLETDWYTWNTIKQALEDWNNGWPEGFQVPDVGHIVVKESRVTSQWKTRMDSWAAHNQAMAWHPPVHEFIDIDRQGIENSLRRYARLTGSPKTSLQFYLWG